MTTALRNPRFWIGTLISLVALVVVASRVDRHEVAEAFRDANYWMLIPAVAMAVVSLLTRTARWRTLFHPLQPPAGELFGILMVGYTVTAVLPLRLGDLARIYLIGQLRGISKVRAAATVIVERVLDVSTVILIMALLIPFVPVPSEAEVAMGIGVAVVSIVGLSIGVSWVRRDAILRRLARRAGSSHGRVWSRVEELSGSAIDGFSVLGSPRATGLAAGYSIATWLTGGVTMWAM
ncbi:MAG TPA: lysylphosphatidylglycerol synthase transmembrane domain-containing protein, partial [Thermomicrobiales bacterium]|nr:lysylphosphatidylglycerol synthase transmembrane domain-containing protein [Thermomicrobiales bacterium]